MYTCQGLSLGYITEWPILCLWVTCRAYHLIKLLNSPSFVCGLSVGPIIGINYLIAQFVGYPLGPIIGINYFIAHLVFVGYPLGPITINSPACMGWGAPETLTNIPPWINQDSARPRIKATDTVVRYCLLYFE